MTPDQVSALMPLYAKKFIQRRDPIAIQTSSGGYRPLRDSTTKIPTAKFDKTTIGAHLNKQATYGHYMLDDAGMTKLFVFDIDLSKHGFVPMQPLNMEDPTDSDYEAWVRSFICVPNLRDFWHSRTREAAPGRAYIKRQLRVLGNTFASSVHSLLGISTAVAYTGNKGIHIYGFTGPVPASDARDAADLVMESAQIFAPARGDNFYADSRREVIPVVSATGDPEDAYLGRWITRGPLDTFDPNHFHNFHVEIFPKQRSLEGKDLGNLVRLPLGRNLHAPSDPTFFVDLTAPMNELRPVDPVFALTNTNPWQTPEEAGF